MDMRQDMYQKRRHQEIKMSWLCQGNKDKIRAQAGYIFVKEHGMQPWQQQE
jgi:hypothetical protein